MSSKEARLVQAKQERDTARTLRHEGQLRGPVRQQVREWVKTKLARKGARVCSEPMADATGRPSSRAAWETHRDVPGPCAT